MEGFDFTEFSWLGNAGEALFILIGGFVVSRAVTALIIKSLKFLDQQAKMVLRKIIFYTLFGGFFVWSLHHLGVDFKLLIGAAGVFSVALGFASQTSASNLISGLFLIIEKPFVVGDTIKVGTQEGVVLSIDLMSTQIRTYDNLMVRVPNESLMKSEITNLTRFPIRRVDILIGISYSEDIERVKLVLQQLANDDPLCLDEPAPQFFVIGFMDSVVQIKYCVWTATDNFSKFKAEFYIKIKYQFDKELIEFPFPQRTIYNIEKKV